LTQHHQRFSRRRSFRRRPLRGQLDRSGLDGREPHASQSQPH
jgi:hypothetical protein